MTVAFASQHTATFPELLRQARASVLVSTYSAGQLIVLRCQNDGVLNTHFTAADKPMGFVANHNVLALGTGFQIWNFRNMPAVAPKVKGDHAHDAAYVPRTVHVTGDIDIHEMGLAADDELWVVNTKMSCLCTVDYDHSIVPRWKPPFISGYDLTDRCHLNGLAMRDGKPAYVTALGHSDKAAGWREHKTDGGILMAVDSGEILTEGLSMPHSPRWYRDQLWVLESGNGALVKVDPATGARETVAEVPGFTRGLDFVDRFALIGLSQVRETNVFAGLPLTRRESERQCGVWVVNIETGETAAYVSFTGEVREIFAVQLVPFRFPVVLDASDPLVRTSYALPDEALQAVVPVDPATLLLEQATAAQLAGELEKAVETYREILTKSPDSVQAMFQLGVALNDLEDWRGAQAILQKLLVAQPGHAEALNALGMAHLGLGDHRAAVSAFDGAVASDRTYAVAHFNRGLVQLKQGNFEAGWEGFEWRWRLPEFTPFQCPQPQWQGEDITDKRLLVHTEQGAGDAIQYARFLPLVAARCERLIVVAAENLRRLFEHVEGVAEVLPAGTLPADTFDVYSPIMSLTKVLGVTADNIPNSVPYVSTPPGLKDIAKVPDNGRPRIGLVWKGSATHKRDKHRSISLGDLKPLLSAPADFYALQTPLSDEEQTELKSLGITPLEPAQPHQTHFGRTAALMEQLDLVIGVDTSVVHLAGAMAKPVWIILDSSPDWRWLQDGSDTAWYPSARLYRAADGEATAAVLRQIRGDLTAFC